MAIVEQTPGGSEQVEAARAQRVDAPQSPGPQAAGILIEGLRKRYGSGDTAVDALKHVDMTVAPGEVVGLIGPSGSGKSTLLKCLGAVIEPSAGRMTLGGETIYDGGWKIREIAVLKLIGTRNRTIASMILQQALGLGLIGFVVGKIAATLWAPAFPKYVLLETGDTLRALVAVMVICVLASVLAIRAALRVDPAEAIGG